MGKVVTLVNPSLADLSPHMIGAEEVIAMLEHCFNMGMVVDQDGNIVQWNWVSGACHYVVTITKPEPR